MSLTYQGVAVMILGWIFKSAGVPFVAESAESTITFVVEFIGVIITLYGRWRAGNIRWFGAKIK